MKWLPPIKIGIIELHFENDCSTWSLIALNNSSELKFSHLISPRSANLMEFKSSPLSVEYERFWDICLIILASYLILIVSFLSLNFWFI